MYKSIKKNIIAFIIAYMLGLSNLWRNEEKTTEEVLEGIEWQWQENQSKLQNKNTLRIDIELVHYIEKQVLV